MLSDLLERIQNKPRHVRVKILWVSVCIAILAVGFIWVLDMKSSFKNKGETLEISDTYKKLKDELPSIKDDLSSIGDNLKADLGEVISSEEQEEFNEVNQKNESVPRLPLE